MRLEDDSGTWNKLLQAAEQDFPMPRIKSGGVGKFAKFMDNRLRLFANSPSVCKGWRHGNPRLKPRLSQGNQNRECNCKGFGMTHRPHGAEAFFEPSLHTRLRFIIRRCAFGADW